MGGQPEPAGPDRRAAWRSRSGALWWLTGTATPLWYWSLVALLGLAFSIFVVPILLVHIALNKGREGRRALRVLAWWSMVVLAPAFVVARGRVGVRALLLSRLTQARA